MRYIALSLLLFLISCVDVEEIVNEFKDDVEEEIGDPLGPPGRNQCYYDRIPSISGTQPSWAVTPMGQSLYCTSEFQVIFQSNGTYIEISGTNSRSNGGWKITENGNLWIHVSGFTFCMQRKDYQLTNTSFVFDGYVNIYDNIDSYWYDETYHYLNCTLR